MTFIQVAQLLLLVLSIFSLAISTFCQIRRLENRVWIRIAAILLPLAFAGFLAGNLSELRNGGLVGAIAFSLSSILLVMMQVWSPADLEKFSVVSSKNIMIGNWVRRSAGLGVCFGVVAAICLIMATDDPEIELLAVMAPFLGGVLGIILQTVLNYPSFGIAMTIFVAGGIGVGMTMNYLENAANTGTQANAKRDAERTRELELLELTESATPESTMNLFWKLWNKRPAHRMESAGPHDSPDLQTTLKNQGELNGRWQLEVVPPHDAPLEIEFLDDDKFKMEIFRNGKSIASLEGTYSIEPLFLRLESETMTLLLKIQKAE